MNTTRIAFAGTDGRSCLGAYIVSTATSESSTSKFEGSVIRGTPGMVEYARQNNWPITFLPTDDNSTDAYARTVIQSLGQGLIDYVVPMPEALLFDGLVDRVEKAGFGDRIAGHTKKSSFMEGDKISCRKWGERHGVPGAPQWREVDAKDYSSVLEYCLKLFDVYGGAVLKFPYSAGGKGARVITSPWQIRTTYDQLMSDYEGKYKAMFRGSNWPLLIESRMAGIEISLTILVDSKGNFQVLPTALDYPERFPGLPGKDNPITGGMGSISPHPMETEDLIKMARTLIAEPIVRGMKKDSFLRPCILYPGCIISFDHNMRPKGMRVCEINIRPGEPEFQAVARRTRNLGALIEAMFSGSLDKVKPNVREDQISMTIALVTGPGGPKGQKGYPWSVTKFEPMEIDTSYLRKRGIFFLPSAMTHQQDRFLSDGTRVAYLLGNTAVKSDTTKTIAARQLRQKLMLAHEAKKVRVVPREDQQGDRLVVRADIGEHYQLSEELFS